MTYKTASGITFVEGIEVIRLRPAMYIGEGTPERPLAVGLVESALVAIVTDTPRPSAVRLVAWNDGVFTIAFDGDPLPIDLFTVPVDGVPHPELYRFFMYVGAAGRTLAFAGGVLNALSERLVVSTVRGGDRYRAAFAKGSLVGLLAKRKCSRPLGSNWLTFRPDTTVITGSFDTRRGPELCKRAAQDSVTVSFHDRTAEDADWF